MSAVFLLASAFVAIAVVGTALAAVHDVIAAAMARVDVGGDGAPTRPKPTTTPAAHRVEHPPLRAARTASTVGVRLRRADGALPPGVRF
jgi:hypothetical protein